MRCTDFILFYGDDCHCMKEGKNIFQIWEELGQKTPFAVRRANWGPEFYTVVVQVEIKKFPYGYAYGYPTHNGVYSDHYEYDKYWRERGLIPCGGCYQWTLVPNASFTDCEKFLSRAEKRPENRVFHQSSVKKYSVDSILEFGKFKGESVKKICESNPSYFEWCINNIDKFCLDSEAMDYISQKLKFNEETVQNNARKLNLA